MRCSLIILVLFLTAMFVVPTIPNPNPTHFLNENLGQEDFIPATIENWSVMIIIMVLGFNRALNHKEEIKIE